MLLMMRPREDSKKKRSRAIDRDESLAVYGNLEVKGEQYSNRAYDRVEEMYSSFYAGLDPRRRQEVADGGMVKEDKGAMANLSNKPVHREYPPAGYYSSPYLDDSTEEK
jgi:hypothetical protein